MTTDHQHHSLAEWAASPDPTVRPGATIHRGASALDASRALLDAVAADDPASREMIDPFRPGRPALDATRVGKSPTWHVRAPHSLDARMRAQAAAERIELSDLLRRAATEYLDAHEHV